MIAVWRMKKTFVPLGTSYPEKELKYFISDSKIGAILHSTNYINKKNLFKYNEIHNICNVNKIDSIKNINVDNNNKNTNINNDDMKKKIVGVNIANLRIPLFDLSHSTLQSDLMPDSDFDNLICNDDLNKNERKKITLSNDDNSNNNDNNNNRNIDSGDNKNDDNDDRNIDFNENSVKPSDALILYTSGTTGRPKGVAHTRHVITKINLSR